MATYAERSALVTDSVFLSRIQMALWVAATDVISEPTDTPKHERRADWARNTLRSSIADNLREVAVRVLANPTVGSAGALAPDSDIQFVVNSLIDTFIDKK